MTQKHNAPANQSTVGFAPCPTCKQYSHSIGTDQLAEAYLHFHTMEAHPVRGHPMGHLFDEKTRDMVNVVLSALRQSGHPMTQDRQTEGAEQS